MVRILFLAAGAMVLSGAASPARAASAWVAGRHSAVRLLDGGRQGGGIESLGGIEIRLDPGFITYWRSPGEAGVPPSFDFSGSLNVEDAKVDYPAPRLIDEDGTEAYGYAGGVTLPVRIALVDPAAPARLDLSLDYAVCSRICLPVKARMTLDLTAGPDAGTAGPNAGTAGPNAGTAGPDAGTIRDALARVPKPARLGEGDATRIEALAWSGATGIAVKTHAAAGATLFVEAPEPWYFSASPGRAGKDGRMDFTLRGPDRRPDGPLPAEPLRLTLVTPDRAIEVEAPLDAVASKP